MNTKRNSVLPVDVASNIDRILQRVITMLALGARPKIITYRREKEKKYT